MLKIALSRASPLQDTYLVRLSSGKVFLDGQDLATDFHVFADIFLTGVYENLRYRGSVTIDIGAHKGYFAAYALLRGAKAVVCFEPEPINFRFLRSFGEHLHSKAKCVEMHCEAVADFEGQLVLDLAAESWRHSICPRSPAASSQRITVAARPLGAILQEVHRRFPDDYLLLKIDAEGAECRLLLHTPAGILGLANEIIFEYHDFAGCSLEDILNRLRSIGFCYFGPQKDASVHLCRK